MKQQQLEDLIKDSAVATKSAKFKIEFAIMMMATGRAAEAARVMSEGIGILEGVIDRLEKEALRHVP